MGHAEQIFDFCEAGGHFLIDVAESPIHLVSEPLQPGLHPLETSVHTPELDVHLAELGPEEHDQLAILVRRHDLRATIHDPATGPEVSNSIP